MRATMKCIRTLIAKSECRHINVNDIILCGFRLTLKWQTTTINAHFVHILLYHSSSERPSGVRILVSFYPHFIFKRSKTLYENIERWLLWIQRNSVNLNKYIACQLESLSTFYNSHENDDERRRRRRGRNKNRIGEKKHFRCFFFSRKLWYWVQRHMVLFLHTMKWMRAMRNHNNLSLSTRQSLFNKFYVRFSVSDDSTLLNRVERF